MAAAAACAVVEAIDDELLANVAARSAQLVSGLEALPAVREVRGRGLLLAAVLDRDAGPSSTPAATQACSSSPAGTDVLRFLPPLVVTEAEVDEASLPRDDARRGRS